MAAEGILVLQLGAVGCPYWTPEQGPCAVSYYEAAAKQLISDGLVDPERIGIIGFSASCFTVMETLTIGSLHLKAASITDGTMKDYFQFIQQPELESKEDNAMFGASPFGEGLQQWLKRSPGFNLDKVNTPLLVNALGRVDVLVMWEPYAGLHYLHKPVDLILLNTDEHVLVNTEGRGILLLGMWEPYAGLHYLHKPVDLIILNTDEHTLTNPAVRMASQGGSVDWFRFWLQDYEDPDPAKTEQYKRWRGLRELQAENEKKSATIRSATN